MKFWFIEFHPFKIRYCYSVEDNIFLCVIIFSEKWHNIDEMKKSDKCQPGYIIIAVSVSIGYGPEWSGFEYSLLYWLAVWLKWVI